MRSFLSFVREEDGVTSVEYAVMLAVILLVVISAITAFGDRQKSMWTNIDGEMEAHGI
jgi:pilus assembly protein Flp/PilA